MNENGGKRLDCSVTNVATYPFQWFSTNNQLNLSMCLSKKRVYDPVLWRCLEAFQNSVTRQCHKWDDVITLRLVKVCSGHHCEESKSSIFMGHVHFP